MHIKSKFEGIDQWICNETIQDKYIPNSGITEKRIAIEHPDGLSLDSRQIITDSLFIMDNAISLSKPINTFSAIDEENITMDFTLHGNANYDINGLTQGGKYEGGVHNIRYTPSLKGTITVQPTAEHKYFLIMFSRNFYFHLLNQQSLLESDFVQQMLNGTHALLTKDSVLNISIEMYRLINEIRNCTKKPDLKRLFIESKIMELFMLQIEQYQSLNSDQTIKSTVLRNNDRDKIQEAKKIIEITFQNPPVLKKLAQLVGLNEFKLKHGFKEVFGTTVYSYITELKMGKAKSLINIGHSISEVCYEVGFKNPSHFTVAFKNYFNYLPSEIKKSTTIET